MANSIDLKPGEIARVFDQTVAGQPFPPIVDPEQIAQMLGYSKSTIYEWLCKGRFDGAYRKRGKRVKFLRDRVLSIFFDGPDWS